MPCHPPRSTLFPYTTLFRSELGGRRDQEVLVAVAPGRAQAYGVVAERERQPVVPPARADQREGQLEADRKSTRLNSSHQIISYAVFCLKKKKRHNKRRTTRV